MNISLNGDWRLEFFPQPAGGAVRDLPVGLPTESVAAQVPGCCELDLSRAGLLPPPERGLNVREWRRYEGHQWLYTRDFEAPEVPSGGKATLRFEGIDTLADVFLNGERIGEAANMLVEHRFDVTRRLRKGTNTVQVLLRSAFLEQQGETAGFHAHRMSMAEGARLRKAAYMGGWDIFPRLFVSGLWRDASLEVEGPVRLKDVFWVTGDYSQTEDGTRKCRAMVQFRVEGPMSLFLGGATFRITAERGGRRVVAAERRLNTSGNRVTLDAGGFELWWPAGSGEHPLYDARVELVSPSGEILASDSRRIGFRTVELVRRDRRGGDPGAFLFKVNGEPLFMRGTNWVPADAIPSRQAARILPALRLVEELRCNMLRCWGGGVYEPDFFYDWCDEHGILVWQDFMTGCLLPPQDDAYAAATAEEAKAVVLRLRNHPALALWAGNNENDHSLLWSRLAGVASPNPNDDRVSRTVIPQVLRDFDPTRPYLPSSPYVSPDVAAGLAEGPEDHLWGARNWYKEPFYVDSPAWFASETGWHGCPARATLESMMSEACVYPWKNPEATDPRLLDWNDEWRLKSSCPFLDPAVLWDRNDIMTRQVANLFGDASRDLDGFVYQSQTFQAEALKTMIEVFRARKFTRTSGLLWWNAQDGWPQISDAVVDGFGNRKEAFFAVRDAQRDVLALMLDDHSAWIVNDRLSPVTVRATFRAPGGSVLLDGEWRVAANAALRVGEVAFEGQGVVDIAFSVDGGPAGRNHYLAGSAPFDWRQVARWLPPRVVSGIVAHGHGVASGKAGDRRFPGGTIAMQAPFFKKLGLDLSGFHPGTINVDCAPWSFRPGPEALLFEKVKWHPEMPAETFSFARATLVHKGGRHPAYIYLPHPETKAEHFQPGGVAEIIAPRIDGLAYGDRVTLETERTQAVWTMLPSGTSPRR